MYQYVLIIEEETSKMTSGSKNILRNYKHLGEKRVQLRDLHGLDLQRDQPALGRSFTASFFVKEET